LWCLCLRGRLPCVPAVSGVTSERALPPVTWGVVVPPLPDPGVPELPPVDGVPDGDGLVDGLVDGLGLLDEDGLGDGELDGEVDGVLAGLELPDLPGREQLTPLLVLPLLPEPELG
jgi:hypothetical protein